MNIDFQKITIEALSKFLKEIKKSDVEVKPESKLVDDLLIDSLDLTEVAISLKEKNGINFDVEKMMSANFNTVKDIVDYLKLNSSN